MPQHSWVETTPYLLRGSSRMACLVIHGFAGTPAEIRPFAEALAKFGVTVYVPVLPGHAATSAALLRYDRHDWLNTAMEAWDWLAEDHDRVFVAGLSMGSLLALKLSERRRVPGLVLMAPALIARDTRIRFAGALSLLKDFVPEAHVPSAGLVSPRAWKRLWHYEHRALKAISQLYKLQLEGRMALGQVSCPTLVFHGLNDLTVPEQAAQEVYDRLGTTHKQLVWLANSGHCLTADGEAGEVAARVSAFFDRIQSQT